MTGHPRSFEGQDVCFCVGASWLSGLRSSTSGITFLLFILDGSVVTSFKTTDYASTLASKKSQLLRTEVRRVLSAKCSWWSVCFRFDVQWESSFSSNTELWSQRGISLEVCEMICVSWSFLRVFSSEHVLGCIGYVEEAIGISELWVNFSHAGWQTGHVLSCDQ